jgi:hypothetical protein
VTRRWIWALPPLFVLWVYWSGLRAWFVADDFVWLGLLNGVHGVSDLWPAIFQPTIQGTLRPWSDRVFFLVFRALFDMDGFPYHAWIFATQMAAAALMMSIVRRLTKSDAAAFAAPIFWTGNAVLVMTMAWACLYKDVLCTFTLLLAFHFLLRYIETGRDRYNLYQWIVFILGFGVMETNVVYPAIAIGYTFLCARPYLRKTLPLLAPSAAYLALSAIFVKKPASGPYRMHFGWNVAQRLYEYGIVALKPDARAGEAWTKLAIPLALALGIVAYLIARWRRGDRLPAVFLLWFFVTVAPVLPLRDQFQTYYLTVAAAGLAMLAGHAIGTAWRTNRLPWRALAIALALVFLIPSVRLARYHAHAWRLRGLHAESTVLGVAETREKHPGQTIVLDRVSTQLFWDIFPDRAFRAVDVTGVYLSPETASTIGHLRPQPAPAEYALSRAAMRDPERIIVYDASGIPLRETTRAYFDRLADTSEFPTRIELDSPLASPFLSGAWHEPEVGHRWMGKQASLRLAPPRSANRQLRVFAHCPENVAAAGPVILDVTINGTAMPPATLRVGDVDLLFPLPAGAEAKPALDVTLAVRHTIHPATDDRELGLPIRVVELR